MVKQVTHIDCPFEFECGDDYSSHRPLLYLCLLNVHHFGRVIEFGSGMGSTPLIRKHCKENKISFYSFDTDKNWCDITCASFIENFADIKLDSVDLLFIDGKPGEQRKDLIKQHSEMAKIILAHDTEPGAEYVYGMNEVLNSFKYRLDYQPEGKPHTTAVSNFINITEWVR